MTTSKITESVIETFAIELLETQGYQAIASQQHIHAERRAGPYGRAGRGDTRLEAPGRLRADHP